MKKISCMQICTSLLNIYWTKGMYFLPFFSLIILIIKAEWKYELFSLLQKNGMEYTRLGQTNIKLSKVCLGTMTFGEQNSASEGQQQMDYALDQGVIFFWHSRIVCGTF